MAVIVVAAFLLLPLMLIGLLIPIVSCIALLIALALSVATSLSSLLGYSGSPGVDENEADGPSGTGNGGTMSTRYGDHVSVLESGKTATVGIVEVAIVSKPNHDCIKSQNKKESEFDTKFNHDIVGECENNRRSKCSTGKEKDSVRWLKKQREQRLDLVDCECGESGNEIVTGGEELRTRRGNYEQNLVLQQEKERQHVSTVSNNRNTGKSIDAVCASLVPQSKRELISGGGNGEIGMPKVVHSRIRAGIPILEV